MKWYSSKTNARCVYKKTSSCSTVLLYRVELFGKAYKKLSLTRLLVQGVRHGTSWWGVEMTNPTLERRVSRFEGETMHSSSTSFVLESLTQSPLIISIGSVNIDTIQFDGLLLVCVVLILVARRWFIDGGAWFESKIRAPMRFSQWQTRRWSVG